MGKKLISIAITAFLIFTSSIEAYGNPSTTEVKLKENKEVYARLNEQVEELEKSIFSLNEEINTVNNAIEANNKEIENLKQKITETEMHALKAREDLEKKHLQYGNRMRYLYKYGGQISYITLLLSAESFSDFIAKLEAVITLLDLDNDMIEELTKRSGELKKLVGSLDNQQKDFQQLKLENEDKLSLLQRKKEEQNSSLLEINSKVKELQRLINSQESLLAQEKAGEDEAESGHEHTEDGSLVSLGVFKLTAYCPCVKCCGPGASGFTATGTRAKANHTISVDPRFIPFGSTVIINGNRYVAEDRGGGVKKYHIDIFFDSHAQALRFGVRYGEVFIKR